MKKQQGPDRPVCRSIRLSISSPERQCMSAVGARRPSAALIIYAARSACTSCVWSAVRNHRSNDLHSYCNKLRDDGVWMDGNWVDDHGR